MNGPFVGVSAVVCRSDRVLLGLRRGAHGAGSWGFPGGKLDPGEDPAAAAERELGEETGLRVSSIVAITWTNDLFQNAGLHFVTLHHQVQAVGEPQIREPDKVDAWRWAPLDDLPAPLFLSTAALLGSGWRPLGA